MKDLVRMARARAHGAETEGAEAIEAGFTLIELMVVLLIIAILLAIAIPTFLGVSSTANDRAAQSNLSNALTESATLYNSSSNPIYSNNGAAYTSQAPEFNWQYNAQCATTVANCVSVLAFNVTSPTGGDLQGVSLAVDSSQTNTCWYAFDLQSPWKVTGGGITTVFPTAGVFYGKATPIPSGGCQALNPDTDTTAAPGGINFTTGGQNYGSAVAVS
jgi:prepilin-type N-terminal cleavage/methylation domain-containing protein